MKKALYILIGLLTLNAWGYYPDCNQTIIEEYYKTKIICNGQGSVIKVSKYLLSTNTLSTITRYRNDKIYQYRSWSSNGKAVVSKKFSHHEDGSILMTAFVVPEEKLIRAKLHYMPQTDEPMNSVREIKQWQYDSSNNYVPKQVEEFIYLNGKRFSSYRETYKDGKLKRSYRFTYDENNPDKKHPVSYEAYGPDGEFITYYNPSSFVLEDYLADYGDQANRKYTIGIIDSDYDVAHPMLAGYFYLNPAEQIDGNNQDGNNWVDDIMGWNHETQSNILLSPITLLNDGGPASHGTHVASLAIDGQENFSIIGYAGDMSSADHLNNVTRDLIIKKVSFTNMSFGFGNLKNPFNAGEAGIKAIGKLIRETPNTLHVIAAGNNGHEIDRQKNHNYPASYPMNNMLVVAALNCDALEMDKMDTYQLAEFSNFGARNTDIMAPGTMVNGAAPGGGMIRYSGTSMASPYALNHGVMAAYDLNPNLTGLQIKEIVIKSAYIKDLDNPAPVYSGGILYPDRIKRVALLLKDSPTLSIEQAVLEVRANEFDSLPGESNDIEYLRRLKNFWESRAAL